MCCKEDLWREASEVERSTPLKETIEDEADRESEGPVQFPKKSGVKATAGPSEHLFATPQYYGMMLPCHTVCQKLQYVP